MTVRRTGSRTPVSTGCGASSTRGTSKPSPRKPVSTGCGTSSTGSTGWKAKTTGGKVSDRSKDLLEKAKGKTEKRTVSTGCGTSKPSTPSKPSKPTRTGC